MKVNNQELGNEENLAREAEARRATAEREFVIITDDKKRVLAELKELELKVDDTKIILEKNNTEIGKTVETIKELKQSYTKEVEATQNAKDVRILAEKDLDIFNAEAKVKIDEANYKLQSVEKQIEIMKAEALVELKVTEDSRDLVLAEIKEKKDELDVLVKKEEKQNEKLFELGKSIQELSDKESSLEITNNSLNTEILSKRKNLQEISDEINQSQNDLDIKKDELKKINISIEEKNVEYNGIEAKIFSLMDRENALASKESFIKSQYARAGIKYE